MSTDVAPRTPRRLNRPRWMDPRVVGGILLVVASVVVGSRVIAASGQTAPIWSAARSLSAGTVLTNSDLEPLDVNLGVAGSHYLGMGSNLVGRAINVEIRPGELIPAAALGDAPSGRIVVIPVPPEKFPPGVDHGSIIDLYLTSDDPAGSGTTTQTALLKSALTVQSVAAPSSGGLSGATANQYQIAVLVDAQTADDLVRTLPSGEAVVVLVAVK